MKRILRAISIGLVALTGAGGALAGQPAPGALGLQPAATRIMERLHFFHGFLLWIIVAITILVMALLLWVMVRYRRSAHPEPKRFSHNTAVEVIWTVVPVLILVAIAVPSFPNLYYQDQEPDLERIAQSGDLDDPNVYPQAAEKGWLTVKAQGNQWNWTYQYTDFTDDAGYPLEFTSNPLHVGTSGDPVGTPGKPRNLGVDYPMVVPANRYIRYQTTASDVIHSWTVPSFGVKTDAVPGKLNQGWFLVEEPGIYFGQCSELCGVNHAYMPIEVRVVPEDQFQRWRDAMLAGNFENAAQLVAEIEPLDRDTRLASAN